MTILCDARAQAAVKAAVAAERAADTDVGMGVLSRAHQLGIGGKSSASAAANVRARADARVFAARYADSAGAGLALGRGSSLGGLPLPAYMQAAVPLLPGGLSCTHVLEQPADSTKTSVETLAIPGMPLHWPTGQSCRYLTALARASASLAAVAGDSTELGGVAVSSEVKEQSKKDKDKARASVGVADAVDKPLPPASHPLVLYAASVEVIMPMRVVSCESNCVRGKH